MNYGYQMQQKYIVVITELEQTAQEAFTMHLPFDRVPRQIGEHSISMQLRQDHIRNQRLHRDLVRLNISKWIQKI